ncbi:PIN domain-containing protein [Mycobacterium sp.]|uniref:PIN domain-containing protein n=1 Tax=Mycobacterium sp. TaxID=1785 RepID=UPI0031E29F68
MPLTADSPDTPTALVDTSVALPALSELHEFHDAAFDAVSEHRAGIAAHALFETYAVLTRHPVLRVVPAQALALLDSTFTHRAALTATATDRALQALAAAGIGGKATYDGLVAATAVEAGLPLLTLDRRARSTYEAVGADVRYI